YFFFFQAEDGIRDFHVTGVQTCALPISQRMQGCNFYWLWLCTSGNHIGQTGMAITNSKLIMQLRLTQVAIDQQSAQPQLRKHNRSEERRVGKECRSQRTAETEKKTRQRK